jgi:beta,beta-carotene 9',10'-dioxygenase
MVFRLNVKNIFLFVVFFAPLLAYFYTTRQSKNPDNHHVYIHESPGSKRKGFESITQETPLQQLTYTGTVPSWLKGTLVGTGPARFEMGPTKAAYWFNGLAMLQAFYFDATSISFQNKFLDSTYYQRCQKNGKFDSSMTSEKKSFFSRLASSFSTPEPYDNGNIGIANINGSFIALTETTLGVVFDPKTLKTIKPFDLNEHLEGHMTTAQFQYDKHTKLWYNYLTNFGQTSAYTLYSIDQENIPHIIASLPIRKPAYMRAFAMTKNYLILVEIPFVINPIDLVLGAGAFIEKIKWKPQLGTNFIVVNKHTGEQVGDFKTKTPFFMFNTVNAFEDNDTITIDTINYNNADVIQCISLEALQSDNNVEFEPSHTTRFTINLAHNDITHQQLSPHSIEFPVVNQQYAMESYSFIYGLSSNQPHGFPQQLIKINIKTGTHQLWAEEGCYASKPTFVANPDSKNEDGGVILSVVFDTLAKKSFLLMVDAETFNELGRADLPCSIPLGLITIFSPEILKK